MSRFLGLFFARDPGALRGVYDFPYHMIGRHALCADHVSSDGGAAALCAGHIRNAGALSRDITAQGIALPPDADDSRLLLNAYRLWGSECVTRIEGAVRLVIIDQDSNTLILSADRMGEAGPVFYADTHCGLAFSDHPEPLLKAPGVSRVVNGDGLRELFALGPARTPGKTPFRDIKQLIPGTYLISDERGLRIERYFRLEARPHEDDESATIARTRDLLEQAVRSTLPFEPLCMLSGGLDSTVLTALLHRYQRDTSVFSVDYEENDLHFASGRYQPEQDAPYAELAADLFSTHRRRIVLGIDDLISHLGEAVEARGFPGMADIDSSLLLFCREIAGNGRTVLSGECSDEVFGGYPWFNREELLQSEGFPWSGSLSLRESILHPDLRSELKLNIYAADAWHDAQARQPRLNGESPREIRLRQLQGICFEFFMSNLQERAAAIGESCGLTVLTPYCDERLVQYVYNVPWDMKRLTGIEKGLLRVAVRDLLPEKLLMRRKSPYPKTYHPQYTKKIVTLTEELLSDSHAPLNPLLDHHALRKLLSGNLFPQETPWFGQLMAGPQMLAYILQFNYWLERYDVRIDMH